MAKLLKNGELNNVSGGVKTNGYWISFHDDEEEKDFDNFLKTYEKEHGKQDEFTFDIISAFEDDRKRRGLPVYD